MTEAAPTEASATAFDINAYLLAPRIVFGAIAATPIFMVAICGVIVAEQEIQPVDEAHLMALGIVSLSLLFGIPILRRRLLPRSASDSSTPIPSLSAAQAQTVVGPWFVANIVSWAFCEAVAMFGCMLTLQSFDVRFVQAFAAIAIVNVAFYRPRKADLEGRLRVLGANIEKDEAVPENV